MRTGDDFGAKGWTPDRLPRLDHHHFVITGGNSGIGFEAALLLGARGARVTILCRSAEKADAAIRDLARRAPAGTYDLAQLDLADLASVRRAAEEVRRRNDRIDALVSNAGIMMTPRRTLTADGFETQFGVNHLGHFALSGLLCPLVEAAAGRFVSVASLVHRLAPRIDFDDIMMERGYSPLRAYSQSKLANLMHALELNRRLEAAGCKARSFACHPGYSDTNLQSTGPSPLMATLMKPATAIFSQSAEKGAVPTALCAAGREAEPGGYYGPRGFHEMTGPVGAARIARQARDEEAAARLWSLSEELTGVVWPILREGKPWAPPMR